MPPVSSLTPEQIAQGFQRALGAEAALRAIGIVDPTELKPLAEFAEAADQHLEALARYQRAKAAHAVFAARHDHDDPGHDEHHRTIAAANSALTAAEQRVRETREALQRARGIGSFAGESGAKQ